MGDAKAKISLVDGTLEFEGSESFVTTQLDKFSEAITGGLKATRGPKSIAKTDGKAPQTPDDTVQANGGLDDIFAATDKGVQILKDIPGDSKSEKMVNAAKLLLYGMKMLKQTDTVLFEDVKAVCKAHGCYDMKNMSTALKDEKEAFVFGGSGKKQSLTLTVPGTKAAAKMVADFGANSSQE